MILGGLLILFEKSSIIMTWNVLLLKLLTHLRLARDGYLMSPIDLLLNWIPVQLGWPNQFHSEVYLPMRRDIIPKYWSMPRTQSNKHLRSKRPSKMDTSTLIAFKVVSLRSLGSLRSLCSWCLLKSLGSTSSSSNSGISSLCGIFISGPSRRSGD